MTSKNEPAAGRPDPLLCYIHINKNFGNTIRDVLDRNYPGRLGEFMVHQRKSAATAGPKTVDSPDDDVRSAIAQVRQLGSVIDCVAINLPYGIHRALDRPVRYFTFLREPVERCISYWYWAYGRRGRGPGSIWHTVESMDFDLARILETNALPQFRNDQTRFVTGTGNVQVTADDFAYAQHLIREKYAFVGAVERFAACHRLLAGRLGWTDLRYGHLNPADRSDRSALPPRAGKLFREYNDVDVRLHRWLVDTFLPSVVDGR
jgi:hypothetical protein